MQVKTTSAESLDLWHGQPIRLTNKHTAFYPDYLGGGFAATFTNLTVTGDFDFGAATVQGLFIGDNDMIEFGNTAATPDVSFGWNTTQTADGLFLGLATGQNTFVIAENGDIAFDFAHAAQTNPTVFVHSATQSTTQWLSLVHDQTDAIITSGLGFCIIDAPSGIVLRDSGVTGFLMQTDGTTAVWTAASGDNIAIRTTGATTDTITIQNQTFTAGAAHNAISISPTWTAENFNHTVLRITATQDSSNSAIATGIQIQGVKTTAAGTVLDSFRGIDVLSTTVAGTITNNTGIYLRSQTGGSSNWGIYCDNNNLTWNFGPSHQMFLAATLHTLANVVNLDFDVNSASVNGIGIDGEVSTALSAGEVMNGIAIDVDGNATDAATSQINGLSITSAGTTSISGAGANTGIRMNGYWDTGILIARSVNFTGVDTETSFDINIVPVFTLTEPAAGAYNLFGINVDLTGISVTAGAGTSTLAALRLVANADADVGTNLALFVDAGTSRLDNDLLIGGASGAEAHHLDTTGEVTFNEQAADIDFRVEGTTVSSLLNIDAGSNFVGIGTTAGVLASAILSIGGGLVVHAGTSLATSSHYNYRASNDAFGYNRFFYKTRNAAIGSHTIVLDNDVLGLDRYYGSDGDQFIEGAIFGVAVDGTPADNQVPAEFYWQTRNAAGTLATRLRLSSEGSLVITKVSAGAGLDLNYTATVYTTALGIADIVRSGTLTGVNTESIIDLNIVPSFTLTEPAGGSVNYYGTNIDLTSITVTAGAGTSFIAALRLVANADTDVGTNLALLVDSGQSRFDGQTAVSMGVNPDNAIVLSVGWNGNTMAAGTTAARHFQVAGNITELANAAITDIVGAYFNSFTITDGGGAETVNTVATVYINNAPTVGTAPTNGPYSLFIDAGAIRIDDQIQWGAGVAVIAGNYSVGRDADGTNQLHFNVPTGATFEWSINDTIEMLLSATAVDFRNNSLSTTGGGSLTGTWTDLGIVTTVDINGGTLDGVTIGGASAAAATVTTLSMNNLISWSAGAAVTAASYQVGRDADGTNQLHFNVPTGATMEFSINDVAVWTSGASVFTTSVNTDINMSAGGRFYGGGIQFNSQTLAANTNLTLDENDSLILVTLGSTSDNTITLPAASGNEGMLITVYVTDGAGVNNAVLTRAGTDTIANGSADTANTTVTLQDTADFVTLLCVNNAGTGDEWTIIAQSGVTVA